MSLANCPNQDLHAELASACDRGSNRSIVLFLTACSNSALQVCRSCCTWKVAVLSTGRNITKNADLAYDYASALPGFTGCCKTLCAYYTADFQPNLYVMITTVVLLSPAAQSKPVHLSVSGQ